MAATPRLSIPEAGTFAAGQVIPVVFVEFSTPLGPNAPAGNAAAAAPAGQRPSTGTVASWEQEITPAGTGLGWPDPLPPKPRNVPGMVSPRSARTRTTP